MSDDDSSQGDDAAGMFTDDMLGSSNGSGIISDDIDDEIGDAANSNKAASSSAESSSKLALLQGLLARKQVKLVSSKRTLKRSASSSSSRTRPVVKLMVTSVSRSYSEPWRRKPQRESSGTGFLIQWDDCNIASNNSTAARNQKSQSIRIITNAHVVRNASTVRARASFGPHVVSCEVEWLSLPLDLALLRITEGDWDDFCKGWSFDDLLQTNDDGDGGNTDSSNVDTDVAAENSSSSNNNNNKNSSSDTVLDNFNNSNIFQQLYDGAVVRVRLLSAEMDPTSCQAHW
jgi:hypothetical protein